jgi:hypothetical protein
MHENQEGEAKIRASHDFRHAESDPIRAEERKCSNPSFSSIFQQHSLLQLLHFLYSIE